MLSLPIAQRPDEPEVPLFTGDMDAEIRRMNRRRAVEHGGRLSFPGKMDCPSWGIPATRCRIGSVLAQRQNSVCHPSVCYAKKGTFRFKNVQAVLEDNYQKLFDPLWAPAIAAQILWSADDRFRWMMSGDVLCGAPHNKSCVAKPVMWCTVMTAWGSSLLVGRDAT